MENEPVDQTELALRNIRESMRELREAQLKGVAGLAIETTEYAIEAWQTNFRFVGSVIGAIATKVETGKSGALALTDSPEYVGVARSYVVDIPENYAGFVIGERLMPKEPELLEILVARRSLKRDDDGWILNFSKYVVSARYFTAARDAAMRSLALPQESSDFSRLHDNARAVHGADFKYALMKDEVRAGQMVSLSLKRHIRSMENLGSWTEKEYSVNPADFKQEVKKPLKPKSRLHPLSVGAMRMSKDYRFEANDFDEYNIMYHLGVLAAAFDANEAFDKARKKREQELPSHPYEKTLELGDYRKMTELPRVEE